jgi:hypothetical protein
MAAQLFKLKERITPDSVLVIMSPSHKVTFLAKIITRGTIILDAGWPLSDGVISRGMTWRKISALINSYVLDYVSFHAADITLVESFAQARRVHRFFGLSKSRIKVSYTGVNENAFSEKLHASPTITDLKKKLDLNPKAINVLFRGRINNESGIATIIEAAGLLIGDANFILLTGVDKILYELPSNCFTLSDVTNAEMQEVYELADVALGQLSQHSRLSFTIPHKAFEAGFFGKCYLTSQSKGILEIYPPETALTLEYITANKIAEALLSLKDIKVRRVYEQNIRTAYRRVASQELLNSKFELLLHSISPK